MYNSFKILFTITLFLIISCDEPKEYAKCLDDDGDLICNTDEILGCTNLNACNYNENSTDDDGSCELNLFCYDSDGDGFGYGDTTQICLDEIPEAWVNNCDDDTDDCDGIKDDCGECNGNNQSEDCAGVCFGSNIFDTNNVCCSNSNIQNITGDLGALDLCLPEFFKWSLTMTARLGEYENDTFIPSSDSTNFIIGTHYLSTDGLDILDDIAYNDIVKPPTIEDLISLYTSHPEWDFFAGDNFIQEYKFHDLDKLISTSNTFPRWLDIFEGIKWDGNMTYNVWDIRFVKFTFLLESEHPIYSNIELSINDETLIYSTNCEDELYFSNMDSSNNECNIIREDFEYILPITFQGGGFLIPFSILIGNTFLY